MYLFYVDESGDTGKNNSPSKFFVLSAIGIHESTWLSFLDDLISFRRFLKTAYGLKMTEEIHASVFLTGNPGLKVDITKNQKILILRECLRFLNSRSDISIITVRIEKVQHFTIATDIFDYAWKVLFQRLNNTLNAGNFIGGSTSDKGIIVHDNTDGDKLRKLLRKMRRFNHVPSRFGASVIESKIASIIEDPISRDSKLSYIHQMVDVVCYFARQYYEPNGTVRKKGLRNYYAANLNNVLNKHAAPRNTINHIVELRA
ncbi:DUF3800 domain-containing protein [Dyadobacter bucti]|uniref:DUF3800 domain-containing protein n=1 Tax=Dyadobacter bucti TaxID=2572203 RepID=UPI003F708B42